MKKIICMMLAVVLFIFCTSCEKEIGDNNLEMANTEKSIEEVTGSIEVDDGLSEAAKLVKAFYDEYFAQEAENEATVGRMGNAERLEVVKRKYMTDALISELHLRTRQYNADAITNSQDDIPLRGKLVFSNGEDEDTGRAIYRETFGKGYIQDIFEFHFIDTEEGKRADSLNVYHEDDDGSGNLFTYERLTKWAIHGEFTEEDILEMDRIRDELDALEAEGYIG